MSLISVTKQPLVLHDLVKIHPDLYYIKHKCVHTLEMIGNDFTYAGLITRQVPIRLAALYLSCIFHLITFVLKGNKYLILN